MFHVFIASHLTSLFRIKTLAKAIKSVKNQTVKCDQIVLSVSFDPSLYKYAMSLVKFAKRMKIVILIKETQTYQFDHYFNIFKNTNILNDDIITFLDDDDLYDPSLVEEVSKHFDNRRRRGAVVRFSTQEMDKDYSPEFLSGSNFTYDHRVYYITEYVQYAIRGFVFKRFFEWGLHKCTLPHQNFIRSCYDCILRDLEFGKYIYKTYNIHNIGKVLYYILPDHLKPCFAKIL